MIHKCANHLSETYMLVSVGCVLTAIGICGHWPS